MGASSWRFKSSLAHMSDEATEEVRKVWETIAPGWVRHRDFAFEQQRGVSERLVEAMGASDGDTILELTSGPGETGLLLAERSPGTKVIVSDFAPSMVKAAASAASSRNLANVECREIDAQHIDLPDSSVQGVMSRYGLMLVPDWNAALAETRRVLASGGTLSYAVWGPLDQNAWMMLFGAAMMQRGHFTPPEGGGFFPLTTPDENRDAVLRAGYEQVDVEVLDNPMNFESMDHYWDVSTSLSGPLALIAKDLPKSELQEVRSAVEGFAAPFKTDSGLALPAQTVLVRAS